MGVLVAESAELQEFAENIFKRFPEAFMALGAHTQVNTRGELAWSLRILPPTPGTEASSKERQVNWMVMDPASWDIGGPHIPGPKGPARSRSRSRRRHRDRKRSRTRSRTRNKDLDNTKMVSMSHRLDAHNATIEQLNKVCETMHVNILNLNKVVEGLQKEVTDAKAKVHLLDAHLKDMGG